MHLQPDIENYKRIPCDLRSLQGGREDVEAFAGRVNQAFKPDELRLYRDDDVLELWLREVSMADFDRVMAEIGAGDARLHALAERLSETVRGIGSYGVRGNKRLFVGFDKERKVVGRRQKELRRGKHYYANDHAYPKEASEIPASHLDKMICGDSEEVLQALPDNCIDLVLTSPPYNFGLDYAGAGGDDAADWEAYFQKLFRVLDECIRVLKYGGRLLVNIQPLFSDYIPSHHIVSGHLIERRMIWKGEILWEKNNYNCKYTAWGSWKSPSSPYLKYTWEFLEIFCKGDLKKAGRPECADIDAESFKKWVLAKWSIAPERNMRRHGHPAMFPEELAERALLLFSFRGDCVLDPFAGAGTSCVVAQRLGRHYLGIDISEEYCRAAERRIAGSDRNSELH